MREEDEAESAEQLSVCTSRANSTPLRHVPAHLRMPLRLGALFKVPKGPIADLQHFEWPRRADNEEDEQAGYEGAVSGCRTMCALME